MIKLSLKKKPNQTGIPEFWPTHRETLVPEMLKKMRNLPINSCKDDTSSESRDSDDSSNDFSASVEESFEVMFVPEEEIQQVNQVWGNQWEETCYNKGGRGGGGAVVSLNIIIMWGGGGWN